MPSAKKTGGASGRPKKSATPRVATAKRRAKRVTSPKAQATEAAVAEAAGEPRVSEVAPGGRAESRRARAASGKTIMIVQYASGIACPKRQKRVLRSLGLRHPHHTVVRPDNPAVRGMVNAITHLVRIVVEGGRGA